jgi:UDP-N-acetylglucosamine diphosphorylase/glucosamine-1-phosphate N-acetyltransferase
MNIILFDHPSIRPSLLPLTFTRPVAGIRVGILTIEEKWAKWLNAKPSFFTQPYLQEKFPLVYGEDNLFINAALCPDEALVTALGSLKPGEQLGQNGWLYALRLDKQEAEAFLSGPDFSFSSGHLFQGQVTLIEEVWHIFQKNGGQIRHDFALLTKGRESAPILDKYTAVYNEEMVFVEEGARIKAAVLNAEDGPIYIGKNAEVQEGALIKGPFALCEGSHVNMGGKMRGDTTIGPFAKVGGEISNSVIFGFSNKAHEGFLGNSVLGEWCNLGADTNTSNLKNNYANVKLWHYKKKGFKDTGLQFCGLVMGDHSKAGINTMFNTGTVVGVSANIFGAGFPRNFVPSFSWGGAAGFTTFQPPKAYEVAQKVMERRKKEFDQKEKAILDAVFEETAEFRIWER